MAPRPWRSKPSPRVDPTRANGEHEACARAPDGAGGGGRAYRRAYRRMKGTRAGALWTHSDACVGRSPHNIHDPGCITGSAVSSARRMFRWSRVRQVFRCAHRTEFAHWTSHSGQERCVATPHGTPARRPRRAQAPHGRRILTRVRTHRRDTGRESVRGRVRGARGVRARGAAAWSASRGHARSGRRSGRRARQARARRSRVVGSRDAAGQAARSRGPSRLASLVSGRGVCPHPRGEIRGR